MGMFSRGRTAYHLVQVLTGLELATSELHGSLINSEIWNSKAI